MLKLAVVDVSAESRNQLFTKIGQLLSAAPRELDFLPHIDVIPLALQELKFNHDLQICVVGQELLRHDLTALGNIRKAIGQIPLIVEANQELLSLNLVEQYARYGADDVISSETTPSEFIRKIVLLSRKPQKKASGKLVLIDSGKGGIGVTTIAAGLAEALANNDQRVSLVDLDVDTQDLSRFLQARPFINENLQALLENIKPLTQATVEECLVNVVDDSAAITCLAPLADSDVWYEPKSRYTRIFLAILEILDLTRNVVVVDVSSARGTLLRSLYRAADRVVYVVNNDAATLYAAVDRLHRLRNNLAPDAQICVLENAALKHGLPSALLRSEFLRAAQLAETAWLTESVPFCKYGYRWPGSGGSIFTQGSERVRNSLNNLARQIGLLVEVEKTTIVSSWAKNTALNIRNKAKNSLIANALLNPPEIKCLPAPSDSSLEEDETVSNLGRAQKIVYLEQELATQAQIEAA